MKFGRQRPAHPSKRHPLAKYINLSTLPTPPAGLNYVSPPAMAGLTQVADNDKLGDCTAAWQFHQLCLWIGTAGNLTSAEVTALLRGVIPFYSLCSGYVPGEPATDHGADENTVLAAARSVGLGGHKIVTAVDVDASQEDEVRAALWLFGGLTYCAELPTTVTSHMPTGPGFLWSCTKAPPNPASGHCFGGSGYGQEGANPVTWGLQSLTTLNWMSWAWQAKYCSPKNGGACFAQVSQDWITPGGQAPPGFDLEQLLADAAEIGPVAA